MHISKIPHEQWEQWLRAFSARHAGWLVSIETRDLETDETVNSRFMQLIGVELDMEDRKNHRINISVRDDHREIKHILFRPSDVMDQLSGDGREEGVRIISLNTVTTVRFRVAAAPEVVNGIA